MKKYLIFLVLILSHFSIYAEGVKLSCIPNEPACINCAEHQTLFPLEKFSSNTGSLDIEADNSEILSDKYLLNGNVEVNSDKLFLAADDVQVSTVNKSLLATGDVRFQDESYLITGDLLTATRDENDNLIATATNANYQDFGAGLGGANGYTEYISKASTSVLLTNSTYSLCPVNENDWLIEADQINLNLTKNRGIADNALIKFYGIPIFYMPKYSWVLSGRGSGFLTPNYSSYSEPEAVDYSSSLRVPFYFNLAPDRDLLVALTTMSSRGLIYEGKYRQLIAPKISPDHEDSMWSIEAKYLPEDKITNLKRWLVNFSDEIDISNEMHFSAKYSRVSDSKYFEEIARTNIDAKTLKSHIKLSYDDEENNLSAALLTEDEQVINAGVPVYTRALEASLSKTFIIDTNQKEKNDAEIDAEIERQLYEQAKGTSGEIAAEKIYNKVKIESWEYPSTSLSVNLSSTKFNHDDVTKESGVRTNGNFEISRPFAVKFPKITPKANVNITNYSLKNSNNINRTILGSGLDVDFTINIPTSIFGYQANHRITPLISYNYRAKKVQGNIPIFDTEDKYTDIITFADLTSGERYTGLDRITNANDITLSLESSYSAIDAIDDDKDLLNMRIAQSFFTDDEVVSDTARTNYETRKSYSDIAASIDFALGKYVISSSAQFNPDTSKLVKKENSLTYTSNSRKFITLSVSDDGIKETDKFYGAYPLTDSIHLFGGRDKTTSTGITNSETTGIAYESCCWAFRVAHFKTNHGDVGYDYSTGFELVLTGLGSTSSPLKRKIEGNIPGYTAKLR
ncbi:LPS assembly protein LptD [Candidatus Pseudothioglobus sp. Uisw_041]|uniref:LPS-assembly protein LptD n=1 Tax=Candidatus Pseudothioglobus sp. Uisw_041 TaxID=3230996 RepID=UPI003A889F1C